MSWDRVDMESTGIGRGVIKREKRCPTLMGVDSEGKGRDRSPIIWSGGDTIDAALKFLLIVRICVHIV